MARTADNIGMTEKCNNLVRMLHFSVIFIKKHIPVTETDTPKLSSISKYGIFTSKHS